MKKKENIYKLILDGEFDFYWFEIEKKKFNFFLFKV